MSKAGDFIYNYFIRNCKFCKQFFVLFHDTLSEIIILFVYFFNYFFCQAKVLIIIPSIIIVGLIIKKFKKLKNGHMRGGIHEN